MAAVARQHGVNANRDVVRGGGCTSKDCHATPSREARCYRSSKRNAERIVRRRARPVRAAPADVCATLAPVAGYIEIERPDGVRVRTAVTNETLVISSGAPKLAQR